jgi:hypothetical protein
MIQTASHLRAGCSKWPFSKAAASEEARRTLRYVEPLSDARTQLADFFSILLNHPIFSPQEEIQKKWPAGQRRHDTYRDFSRRECRPGDRIGYDQKHPAD